MIENVKVKRLIGHLAGFYANFTSAAGTLPIKCTIPIFNVNYGTKYTKKMVFQVGFRIFNWDGFYACVCVCVSVLYMFSLTSTIWWLLFNGNRLCSFIVPVDSATSWWHCSAKHLNRKNPFGLKESARDSGNVHCVNVWKRQERERDSPLNQWTVCIYCVCRT